MSEVRGDDSHAVKGLESNSVKPLLSHARSEPGVLKATGALLTFDVKPEKQRRRTREGSSAQGRDGGGPSGEPNQPQSVSMRVGTSNPWRQGQ